MHIKAMVLEGFKSYGHRVEVPGFDKEFNAITGMNGTGKSNILDGICFVLGITTLGHVRASSLQDLVYKCGHAGITKATVTITFDNTDKGNCPIGYENYEEIRITRQVVMGGKNKYLIDGINVQNKRVADLFCSVQLNVNNPHFLIMQGRITKVLNMKPAEILSMVEESAGTKMYETKKQAAQKTIEKKDAKLKELSDIITEEIAPKIQRLQEERTQFQDYQKVVRELENLNRLCTAWKYLTAEKNSSKVTKMVEEAKDTMKQKHSQIRENKDDHKKIEKSVKDLSKKLDEETGGELQNMEKDVQEKEAREAEVSALARAAHEGLKAHRSKQKLLFSSIAEDEKALTTKQDQLNKMENSFGSLRDNMTKDAEELVAVQERFQAVSSGLQVTEGGQASLQDQLMDSKQKASEASTQISQCGMQKKHIEDRLKVMQKDVAATSLQYKKDQANISSIQKEVDNLKNDMSRVGYDEEYAGQLQQSRAALLPVERRARDRAESLGAQLRRCTFSYRDPEPGFDRRRVKGAVCRLFQVQEEEYCTALETVAGGRLYDVIVDTDVTSKMILQKGQLQQRTTIIPLNKIHGRVIDQQTLKIAQNLVGPDNVKLALSLINFDNSLRPAMEWVFGDCFICRDLDTARQVTYHPRIMRRCVTMDGDVVDPAGTMSGGASIRGSSVLIQLQELQKIEKEADTSRNELNKVESEIKSLNQTYEKYRSLKQKFELKSHELAVVTERVRTTASHQLHAELDEMNKSIKDLHSKIQENKVIQAENNKKAKELENQMKDLKGHRERQLKSVEDELKKIKKQAENSRNLWKQREQDFETIKLEVCELQKSVQVGKEQMASGEETLEQLEEQTKQHDEELKTVKDVVREAQAFVKTKKSEISNQSKEIKKTALKMEQLMTQNSELELQIKELEHQVTKLEGEAAGCANKMQMMRDQYEWITTEREYFGEPGGLYDFKDGEPRAAAQRAAQLQQTKDKLGRNLNTRAHSLLGKEEEQYAEVMKKKKIVEQDRSKLVQVMKELDEKKKKALVNACTQVNKDFGSIFSSLLYGAQAKLSPPDGQTVLEGLEVKIGFNGVWKDGLGELSGGQRSLVALSLILAMLLFNPAPLYILDEVDAALDLNHTQNIGTMLAKHFKKSQFIIVSLKDGMFNNANVLYMTKFVDGMSTVQRVEQYHNRR